jgi:hypothetical protein
MAVLLLLPFAVRAQDATPQQQSTVPQPQANLPQQTPQQQRAEVLRQAQARVNARRKVRIRQIIADTYSHKYEFDFGGGYLRFRPGNHLQHNSETAWDVDITDYLKGDLGVTADFRGYYGTAFTPQNQYSNYLPGISQYAFLFGPRYRFFKGQHWGWTAQAEAGAEHGNFGTGTNGLPPQLIGLYTDTTVLAVNVGASLDYNLGPGLAIRLTPNALFTNYGSTFQLNKGFELGAVYRFGRK